MPSMSCSSFVPSSLEVALVVVDIDVILEVDNEDLGIPQVFLGIRRLLLTANHHQIVSSHKRLLFIKRNRTNLFHAGYGCDK